MGRVCLHYANSMLRNLERLSSVRRALGERLESAWSNPGAARGQYMGCMGWLFSGHLQNPVFVVNKNREYPFVQAKT